MSHSRDLLSELLDGTGSSMARVIEGVIILAISVSVVATILETLPGWAASHTSTFDAIELVCAMLFSLEIILRLWSADGRASPFKPRRFPRLAYLFSAGGVIDILSVVPFYAGATSFMVVRSLRLLRILRLAKLARYFEALRVLRQALRMRRRELVSLGVVASLTIMISATIMYSAEHEAQPNAFTSIPDALWWALCTLTTVGYGDIYPQTPLGRACASMIMILGIGLVALPTGLLGSAFYELTQRRTCPHCGRDLGSAAMQGGGHAAQDSTGQRDGSEKTAQVG